MHVIKESVLVYRKSRLKNGTDVIVTLELPKGTLINRVLSSHSKNRASVAIVKAIDSTDGRTNYKEALPLMPRYRDGTVYRVGNVVTPSSGFDRSNDECAAGIHFFSHRGDALSYN